MFYLLFGCAILAVLLTVYVLSLRRVVPTNEVHIVQRDKATIAYGKDTTNGNVYYQIPSWFPKIGVVVSKLPTIIFDLDLKDYEAYDKEKLPFKVDAKAFFRISDFSLAASRVFAVDELKKQLDGIVKGAVRNVLASDNLESIMVERTKYGVMFTEQVKEQLKEWGVESVKNIELMDVRDSGGNNIIENIMQKKKSAIEKDSRVAVAENAQKAQEAEIKAQQEIALKQREAEKIVGLKKAAVLQEVGIAQEKQRQEVQTEAKVTAEREMEVKRVKEVQAAEIEKQAAEVKASQDREVTKVNSEEAVIKAEADKDVRVKAAQAQKEQVELEAQATKTQIELKAEANLKAAKNEAIGIEAKGKASACAKQLDKEAEVAGDILLKDKVTGDENYQDFMIKQAKVEADKAIGVEQAKNLSNANITIYATDGNIQQGVTNASKILSPKMGLDLASTLDSFANTEVGKKITQKLLKGDENERS